MDAQIAKLFEQAKDDFEQETHQKINFLRHFDTVDDFIDQIKREKSAFGSFREHEHPNFFRHLRNALKPINILAQLFVGPASNVSDASLFESLSLSTAVFLSRPLALATRICRPIPPVFGIRPPAERQHPSRQGFLSGLVCYIRYNGCNSREAVWAGWTDERCIILSAL